jgi:hypothetical protein
MLYSSSLFGWKEIFEGEYFISKEVYVAYSSGVWKVQTAWSQCSGEDLLAAFNMVDKQKRPHT